LNGAAQFCQVAVAEFDRIRKFLTAYMASQRELAARTCP
jgi:hypothetical protein